MMEMMLKTESSFLWTVHAGRYGAQRAGACASPGSNPHLSRAGMHMRPAVQFTRGKRGKVPQTQGDLVDLLNASWKSSQVMSSDMELTQP